MTLFGHLLPARDQESSGYGREGLRAFISLGYLAVHGRRLLRAENSSYRGNDGL